MSSNEITNSTSDASWSLSIKPVGAEQQNDTTNSNAETTSTMPKKDFVVEVSPDDDLASLYEQIEGVTGLKASQQRLIYRGRLIGRSTFGDDDNNMQRKHTGNDSHAQEGGADMKIKDIRGLSNGQTIHLVKKRDQPEGEERNGDVRMTSATSAPGGASESSSESSGEAELFGSSSAAPLLAALLGLGDDDRASSDRRSWRSSRMGGSSRRRFHHRLTSEDLQNVPDPGSLESVRQGMMTLHTMLPHAQAVSVVASSSRNSSSSNGQQSIPVLSPLEAKRRWYAGQWIDCLDTVNQWLEATITEIVNPEDILAPTTTQTTTQPTTNNKVVRRAPSSSDPVVTATDLEGRKRLLLEPCDEEEVNVDDNEGDGERELLIPAGFRRRDNNDGVQLLLIHYNGWPHRWDEWIRSDSDRLRPFRVRTRHPTSGSGSSSSQQHQHASPTPQSSYSESPSTLITNQDEAADRAALLPELNRVMTAVNELLSATTAHVASHHEATAHSTNEVVDAPHLPWTRDSAAGPLCSAETTVPSPSSAAVSPACLRTELEALAPLLDRLGRTLIDVAPQVSALSRSSSLLTANNNRSEEEEQREIAEEHPTSLGGLLSLLGRDRRRQSNASSNVVVPMDSPSAQEGSAASEDTVVVDPDLSDFAYGVVNTTRGEVRRGPRSSRGSSDDAAGLLGAYLAAASLGSLANTNSSSDNNDDEDGNALRGLGRILRERGNGGGGIDIHIHAVVTSPGGIMPTAGGLGLTAALAAAGLGTTGLGGTGNLLAATEHHPVGTAGALFSGRSLSSRHSPSRAATTRPPPVMVQDDEDDGIFSELYSENPDPVDPTSRSTSLSENNVVPHLRDGRSDHASSGHSTPLVSSPPRTTSFRSNSSTSRSGSWRQNGVERSTSSNPRHRGGGGVFGRLFRRNASTDGD